MKWLSALKTGQYSDTYIFIVGAYDTKDQATHAAEDVLSKARELRKRYEEVQSHDDPFEEELTIDREHEKLFNQEGDWFPTRDPEDWDIIVEQVGDKLVRIF